MQSYNAHINKMKTLGKLFNMGCQCTTQCVTSYIHAKMCNTSGVKALRILDKCPPTTSQEETQLPSGMDMGNMKMECANRNKYLRKCRVSTKGYYRKWSQGKKQLPLCVRVLKKATVKWATQINFKNQCPLSVSVLKKSKCKIGHPNCRPHVCSKSLKTSAWLPKLEKCSFLNERTFAH